jgi:hypothetical protein
MMTYRNGYTAFSAFDAMLSQMFIIYGASSDDLPPAGTSQRGDRLWGSACVTDYYLPSQNNATFNDELSNQGDADITVYIYSYPNSHADWLSRGRDWELGFKAAGRDIVYVGGRAYLRGDEPRNSKYDLLANSPGNYTL